MNTKQMKIKVNYIQLFLPNKRCRKPREALMSEEIDINVKTALKEEEFPVAFVVSDYETRYENEEESEFRLCKTQIRAYNEMLYRPVRASEYACKAPGWATFDPVKRMLERTFEIYPWGKEEVKEGAILLNNTLDSIKQEAQELANIYILFDGKVWKKTGEPMYMYLTFGLGHNHGGTGFFIEDFYNGNISYKNYFNALEKEKAIESAVETALKRGDTESVDSIRKTDCHIEVIMPHMVKRNPKKDHGEGDPFLNALEGVTESSESVMDAGLGVIAMTAAEIS